MSPRLTNSERRKPALMEPERDRAGVPPGAEPAPLACRNTIPSWASGAESRPARSMRLDAVKKAMPGDATIVPPGDWMMPSDAPVPLAFR